jgi:hypothetical protein
MKRTRGTWKGVDMGTAIACDDLVAAGFPEAVRTGCE